MADTRKSRGRGNTIIPPPLRNRNWMIVINNYSEEEKKNVIAVKANYIFQCERGENGTPHIQGVLVFKNARTLAALKKLFPRAHLEIVKSIDDSLRYCCKAESRIEGPWAKGYDLAKYIDTFGTAQSASFKVDIKNDIKKMLYENNMKSLDQFLSEMSDEEKLKFNKL